MFNFRVIGECFLLKWIIVPKLPGDNWNGQVGLFFKQALIMQSRGGTRQSGCLVSYLKVKKKEYTNGVSKTIV